MCARERKSADILTAGIGLVLLHRTKKKHLSVAQIQQLQATGCGQTQSKTPDKQRRNVGFWAQQTLDLRKPVNSRKATLTLSEWTNCYVLSLNHCSVPSPLFSSHASQTLKQYMKEGCRVLLKEQQTNASRAKENPAVGKRQAGAAQHHKCCCNFLKRSSLKHPGASCENWPQVLQPAAPTVSIITKSERLQIKLLIRPLRWALNWENHLQQLPREDLSQCKPVF